MQSLPQNYNAPVYPEDRNNNSSSNGRDGNGVRGRTDEEEVDAYYNAVIAIPSDSDSEPDMDVDTTTSDGATLDSKTRHLKIAYIGFVMGVASLVMSYRVYMIRRIITLSAKQDKASLLELDILLNQCHLLDEAFTFDKVHDIGQLLHNDCSSTAAAQTFIEYLGAMVARLKLVTSQGAVSWVNHVNNTHWAVVANDLQLSHVSKSFHFIVNSEFSMVQPRFVSMYQGDITQIIQPVLPVVEHKITHPSSNQYFNGYFEARRVPNEQNNDPFFAKAQGNVTFGTTARCNVRAWTETWPPRLEQIAIAIYHKNIKSPITDYSRGITKLFTELPSKNLSGISLEDNPKRQDMVRKAYDNFTNLNLFGSPQDIDGVITQHLFIHNVFSALFKVTGITAQAKIEKVFSTENLNIEFAGTQLKNFVDFTAIFGQTTFTDADIDDHHNDNDNDNDNDDDNDANANAIANAIANENGTGNEASSSSSSSSSSINDQPVVPVVAQVDQVPVAAQVPIAAQVPEHDNNSNNDNNDNNSNSSNSSINDLNENSSNNNDDDDDDDDNDDNDDNDNMPMSTEPNSHANDIQSIIDRVDATPIAINNGNDTTEITSDHDSNSSLPAPTNQATFDVPVTPRVVNNNPTSTYIDPFLSDSDSLPDTYQHVPPEDDGIVISDNDDDNNDDAHSHASHPSQISYLPQPSHRSEALSFPSHISTLSTQSGSWSDDSMNSSRSMPSSPSESSQSSQSSQSSRSSRSMLPPRSAQSMMSPPPSQPSQRSLAMSNALRSPGESSNTSESSQSSYLPQSPGESSNTSDSSQSSYLPQSPGESSNTSESSQSSYLPQSPGESSAFSTESSDLSQSSDRLQAQRPQLARPSWAPNLFAQSSSSSSSSSQPIRSSQPTLPPASQIIPQRATSHLRAPTTSYLPDPDSYDSDEDYDEVHPDPRQNARHAFPRQPTRTATATRAATSTTTATSATSATSTNKRKNPDKAAITPSNVLEPTTKRSRLPSGGYTLSYVSDEEGDILNAINAEQLGDDDFDIRNPDNLRWREMPRRLAQLRAGIQRLLRERDQPIHTHQPVVQSNPSQAIQVNHNHHDEVYDDDHVFMIDSDSDNDNHHDNDDTNEDVQFMLAQAMSMNMVRVPYTTLSDDQFNSLPICRHNQGDTNWDDIDYVCAVCQDTMDEIPAGQSYEDIVLLQCNHKFHHNCIREWLVNNSAKCPVCKQSPLFDN